MVLESGRVVGRCESRPEVHILSGAEQQPFGEQNNQIITERNSSEDQLRRSEVIRIRTRELTQENLIYNDIYCN